MNTATISTEIDTNADILDVRDIIQRVEELREEREASDILPAQYGGPDDTWQDERAELAMLESFLSEIQGCGGDEQWEGEWYPGSLIADSYFEKAMDELLEDIGDIPRDLPSYLTITIDYDALQSDYSSADLNGTTYWMR